MIVICSYCGSECGEREQADGRCGSCACFFTGGEQVLESETAATGSPSQADAAPSETAATASRSKDQSPLYQDAAPIPSGVSPASQPTPTNKDDGDGTGPKSGFDPTAIEDDAAGLPRESEGLIQPRKLSPQFRRRVEKTWQSTLSGNSTTAEHTLSSAEPNTETKRESPTLSIATRNIAGVTEGGEGASSSDYQLNNVIGEGSMGRVWSARQNSLARNVAVKVPRPELASSGSVGESQFISEVVVTGQLEHPNIVPIYELGRDPSGVPFYSMKHVQGRPWNEFIDDRSQLENLEIFMKVCDAIAFAHDRNFLHRDIKPHNVMVGEFGEVSVMDWGIAVSIKKDPDKPWASIATGPAGTPAYMAPEMAAHNPSELGVVSDVYLLGAVLYEIVTGTPPHPKTGSTADALLAAAANEIIPTKRAGELVDIARRAMATKTNDRYQSVKELQDALREYQSHRESIKLSESADEHFAQAMELGSSDEYARARFAFEEALRLWNGNTAATEGLRLATIAHANNALEQENYEMGIGILDSDDPDHKELLSKLESRQAGRRRLAWVSKLAAAVAVIAILSVAVVTISSNKKLADSNLDLEKERDTARRNEKEAIDARKTADEQKSKAEAAESRAKTAKNSALEAKVIARGMERSARMEKWRAEEAAYSSDIALAAESIQRNQFNKASATLDRMDPLVAGLDGNVMAPLRHLEWGLLTQAANPGAVKDLLSDVRVESVGSSLSGNTICAGSSDGAIRVWTSDDGMTPDSPTRVFRLGQRVTAVAVSPGGQYVAASGFRDDNDGTNEEHALLLWDLTRDSDAPVLAMRGHDAAVHSIAFSRDGNRIVSSGSDRKAIAWDRSTGQVISIMRDHLDRDVWSACFSPNADLVVTACDDGRVRIWDLSGIGGEASKLHDFRGHEGPVYAVTFSPDGRSVFSGGYDQRILRWTVGENGNNSEQRFADLESRLEGSSDQHVDYEEIGNTLQRHESSIRSLSILKTDGQERLLSSGNDNTLRVWNLAGDRWDLDKILRGHGRWVRSAAFSDDGKQILSGAYDGAKLWTWRDYSMPRILMPNTEGRLGNQPSELGLSAATVTRQSKDKRWVATAFSNGTVSVWDMLASDQAEGQTLVEGHALLTAKGAFFNHGRQLMTSAGDNTTRLWDTDRGTASQTLMGTGYRGVAAVSPRPGKGTMIVTGSDERSAPATLWFVENGKVVRRLPLLTADAESRLSSQLQKLSSASLTDSSDSPFQLTGLQEADYKRIRQWTRMIPEVTSISFSRDGARFALGNADGQCFLYEFEAGTDVPVQTSSFRAHGESLIAIEFLPDGNSLLTASSDGQIRQWNVADGTQLTELPWAGPVTSIRLSEDGTQLLIGHAPMMGRDNPIARLFSVDGTSIELSNRLTVTDSAAGRDWGKNEPTVQSVRFVPGSDQALISLFFPTRRSDGTMTTSGEGVLNGYHLGYWDLENNSRHFKTIEGFGKGEIASAELRRSGDGVELLLVGGKGARLWKAAPDAPQRFNQLVASFRPASSITAIDFSYDAETELSNRLVVGDSDGNIRVFELDGQTWSETTGAAAQLTGHHQTPVIATAFDPTDPNQMISADQSGTWYQWSYDDRWEIQQTERPSIESTCGFAGYSPSGDRVLVATEQGAQLWKRGNDGTFARILPDWKTGPVNVATFSADGSWMVTGKSDQSVTFWDSRGGQITQIPSEDVKGLTSMALSRDRRRFVTGQNERIVIWDTSRIIEAELESRPADALVKELLTLEEHRRVASVMISPDGTNLLSSGSEGKTVIWKGRTIAPLSIAFAGGQLDYRPDSPSIRFDDKAMVSDPSNLASFEDADLIVSISGPVIDGEYQEQLFVSENDGTAGPALRVTGKTLLFRPHAEASFKSIGLIKFSDSDSKRLHVSFNQDATDESIQLLIRSLSYRVANDEPIITAVSAAPTETSESSAVITRNLKIRLSGVSYREQAEPTTLTEEQRKTLYPDAIEMEISIEVELPDRAGESDQPGLPPQDTSDQIARHAG